MSECKLTIKDSSLAFLSGFLFSQIMVALASVVGILICNILGMNINSATSFFNGAIGYLILTIVLDVCLVLTFLFFNKRKNNTITTKLNVKKVLFYLLVSLLSLLALNPIVVCFNKLISFWGYRLQELPYVLNTKNYFISLFSLVLLPAIAEELLFRGLIFKGLKPYGKVFSIVASAIMFSIFHVSIDQTIYPILLGLLLSVIMYYENNIIYCIIIHVFNNFLALSQKYFGINLYFNHFSYVLLAFVLLALYLTIVLYFAIKNNKNSHKTKTKQEKFYFWICLAVMIIMWLIINIYRITKL